MQQWLEMTHDHMREANGRLCTIARPAVPNFVSVSVHMPSACHGQGEQQLLYLP